MNAIPTLNRLARATAVLAAGLLLLGALGAASAEEVRLDRWPAARGADPAALQHGARLFVSYCLNCHSATQMRWSRLRDIGLDETQIKTQLIYGEQKVGDMMTVTMAARDAKIWFGKAPPDLSVIVRARNTAEHGGADYIYTLLRGFYRDRTTLTGWNNVVYPNISMPNILWQRQGPRTAAITRTESEERAAEGKPAGAQWVRTVTTFDAQGNAQVTKTDLDHGTAGFEVQFTPLDEKAAAQVDSDVADIVAFLNWMSEPTAGVRHRIGAWVMGFLVVFLLVARWLNRVYWRDVK